MGNHLSAQSPIPPCHRAGRPALVQGLGRWLHRLSGWQLVGAIPEHPKLILAVGPHTSNWDFLVGIVAMLALDLRVHFLAKHTLFRWPVAGLLRALGGMAVDRGNATGIAEQIGSQLRDAEQLVIAITPEGTRKKVPRLKTGFVRIARAGNCPVQPVTFDFARRIIQLHEPFFPGADPEGDAQEVRAIFAGATAKRPANF